VEQFTQGEWLRHPRGAVGGNEDRAEVRTVRLAVQLWSYCVLSLKFIISEADLEARIGAKGFHFSRVA
jgi:hypothetical protein